MLPNESEAIRLVLSALPPSRIAMIGSGTEDYYKGLQPYIWRNVYEPFQGIHKIINFDLRSGPGVDVVVKNLNDYQQRYKFDLVLACSLLEHVDDPKKIALALYDMVKKDGTFLFSSPGEWPYNEDPIDNMLRFDTIAKWRAVLPPVYDIKAYYKLEPMGPGFATMVICRRTK